jgi:c-di-GMP-binding flagellar brake protein YcgR
MQHDAAEPTLAPEQEDNGPKLLRFTDMHLGPGDRLQIYGVNQPDRTRHICRLIGFLEGSSLLITNPTHKGTRVDFRESELVVVQAFSRNSAYAFKSTVERVCRVPFDYLHLSYPERVEGAVIRKATRVRLNAPANITPEGGGEAVPATIENISSTGALLCSEESIGAKGEALKLAFRIKLHDVARDIESRAVILNARNDEGGHHYGVEFRDLPPDERMVLRSLVYQHIIDHPRSVV